MPKGRLESEDAEQEFDEKLALKYFETTLEWMGWGALATLLTILVAMALLNNVNLDSETSALILIAIYLWVVSWGTGRLVKDNPDAWKHYLYWWTAAIILGGILCILGVTIVPT